MEARNTGLEACLDIEPPCLLGFFYLGTEGGQVNSSSKRGRGRPASENLGRFYIATNLLSHPKLLRLRRELAIGDREAYLLAVRLFDFVATFHGVSAHVPRRDYEALAAFCFWEGDASFLVSAFRRAGIIDNEGDVHEWSEFQPDAKKRGARRAIPNPPEGAPPFMANNVTQNSEAPPEPIYGDQKPAEAIMDSKISQNSAEHKNNDLAEPEVLASDLLSLRERERVSTRVSSYARAREKAGKPLSQLVGDLNLKQRNNETPDKLGALTHLAAKVFSWAGISSPTAGDVANLKLAASQIGADGLERLLADFAERGYEPENKLAALLGAARAEYRGDTQPERKLPEKPTSKAPQDTTETQGDQ